MKTNPGIGARLGLSILATALLLLGSRLAIGARFDSTQWYVREFNPRLLAPSGFRPATTNTTGVIVEATNSSVSLTVLYDNDPSTGITLGNRTTLLVDLGQTSTIHRVLLMGNKTELSLWPDNVANQFTPPLGLLVVYIGDTRTTTNRVAEFPVPYDAGNPIDTKMDLRFSPTPGRFLRVELQTQVNWGPAHWPGYDLPSTPPPGNTNLTWRVGELELFGLPGSFAPENAVVLPAGAARPLELAASELSYYLGELSGKPHPIITPAQTNSYPGTLYTIVDLKPLAPNYATMTNNMASGVLPTNEVNVIRNGRVVTFTGWPYRCVLWSVWEFLERQGVRWVYPDSHGELVPRGKGVDLSILPLQFASSAKIIYANWDVSVFEPWPHYMKQTPRQEYLYAWRNRWTGASAPYGGNEIPARPNSGIALDPQYSEGFLGYPHNMNSVMPGRILATNQAWWGSPDGTNYSNVGVQFEMASTSAATWIARKLTNYGASSPIESRAPLSLIPEDQSYPILPMDYAIFSVGTNMQAATNLYGGRNTYVPWRSTTLYTFSGGAYYKLLATVASNAPKQIVGGLAYADVFDAPRSNYPPNVRMEVTLWGAPNLPYSSPANAEMWNALTNWHRACSKLAYYDYALLFVDYWHKDPKVPVPMVSALSANARMLGSLGMLNGGCQAFVGASTDISYSSLRYNPWDYYAYPRTRWNTNYTAPDLITEFITGYYQEAAAPMLAYYKVMEDCHLTNQVNLHTLPGYCYWLAPGSFPRPVLSQMQTQLQTAYGLATNWYVVDRLNDASNSWFYCCTNQGIIDLGTLTNFSSFPSVPASSSYSVNLGNMEKYWPTRSVSGFYISPDYHNNGGVMELDFNGSAMASQTLNFTLAGNYRVDVVSYCSYPPNGWPSQNVFLGGANSGPLRISNTAPMTNSFVVNIPSPTALDLVVSQDDNGRFLRVTKIFLTRQ